MKISNIENEKFISGVVICKDGVWKYGVLKDGIWEDGVLEVGLWKDGIWEGITWEVVTLKDGVLEYGYILSIKNPKLINEKNES